MFNLPFTSRDDDDLDKEIRRVLSDMSDTDSNTDEYKAMVTNLRILMETREGQQPRRVSPDTVLIVAANLIGILAVLEFEDNHVITRKALSFVLKPRL